LFGFGNNKYDQLGLGIFDLEFTSKLKQLNFFNDKNILDFSCGNLNSYVLIGSIF
jgi:hypothetical protein